MLLSGVAPANQTKERAKTKNSHEFRPYFCEFWCFSSGNQARNSHLELLFRKMPVRKVQELTFLWFGLQRGDSRCCSKGKRFLSVGVRFQRGQQGTTTNWLGTTTSPIMLQRGIGMCRALSGHLFSVHMRFPQVFWAFASLDPYR